MSRVERHGVAVALLALAAAPAAAQGPRAETRAAWGRYVEAVESAHAPASAFSADERAQLDAGEVVIGRACPDGIDVPSGTIEHWRGAMLIRGVSVASLVAALEREPLVQEDVLRSQVLARSGHQQRVYLRLTRRSIVTVTYDTEHDVTFVLARDGTATSRSVMTTVAEVDDAGTPQERRRASGDDHGFLWRLNVYGSYAPVGDGVLVVYESVTLSRDVPRLLRPLAGPIISRIARESMRRSLDVVRVRVAATRAR